MWRKESIYLFYFFSKKLKNEDKSVISSFTCRLWEGEVSNWWLSFFNPFGVSELVFDFGVNFVPDFGQRYFTRADFFALTTVGTGFHHV